MLLDEIARTSAAVAETSARSAKGAALASCLRDARPDEAPIAVAYLSGILPHGPIGVGWAALRDLPPPAERPSLELLEVDAALRAIGAASGAGSQAARRRAVAELFSRATEPEQRFLRALLHGELRQGALESVVADAVARASGVQIADVRRALMLTGDLGVVAAAALSDGPAGLARFGLEVLRPLKPMLAQTAESTGEALARVGAAAVEWKLDGARLQVHRRGDEVRAFTRNLADITERVPEVVEAVLALPVDARRPRRRGDRAPPGRSPRALPGDDEPLREPDARRAHRALPVLLRLPPPRRPGPSRPSARGTSCIARRDAYRSRCGLRLSRRTTPRRPSASSKTRSRTATRA